MELNKEELSLIKDTGFLIAKAEITKKLYKLMEAVKIDLKEVIENSNFNFPNRTRIENGKISRGENYLNLPYMVLDFPSLFLKDDVFAYRTMFWWGNFFSATLQLQGKSYRNYRNKIADNIDYLENKNIFIGVGKSPWHYHYGKDNYVLLTSSHKKHVLNHDFLKLSKKIDLEEWNNLPEFSSVFLAGLLSILNC